jgi:hypothetical protein
MRMNAYQVSLFFHFVGLISLFGAAIMMHQVGARVRRASTVEEVRLWLGFGRTIQPMFPIGSILLLLSGGHMAGSRWGMDQPWIVVGLTTVLLLIPVGPLIQRPRFMAMARAAMTSPPGPVSRELARLLTDPAPWSLQSLNAGAATGLLWIMTLKPGWAGSVAAVVLLAAAGGAIGHALARLDAGRIAVAAAGARAGAGQANRER